MVQVEAGFQAFKDFFFPAMLKGYAGGAKAIPIPGSPGWKGYIVEEGPWRLVDQYVAGPQDYSFGNTSVWRDGGLVFHMTYGGRYPKEVTQLLRKALYVAYEKQRVDYYFRGIDLFYMDQPGLPGYTYYNTIGRPNEGFTHFHGREHIKSTDGREVGYHTYEGWSWF